MRSAVSRTRASTLLAVAVVSAAVAWTGVRVATSATGELPDVPRSAPFALAFLAAVLIGGGLIMRRRVQRWVPGRERVSPDLAVRLLALAKASAITGALVTGGYVGAAVFYAGGLEVPFRQTATWWSLGSAAVAALVVAAASWLERECVIPPTGTDDS